MKHPIKSIALISLIALSLSAYSNTVTVIISGTTQVINLGSYGDKTVTQINLTCGTSATSYKWSVDGPWQTTSGQTNAFNTSVNHISLVPKTGYAGCGSGTVSVSNGGGSSARTMSTFSYIITLSQPVPTIVMTSVLNTNMSDYSLVNPNANISSYSWYYTNVISGLTLSQTTSSTAVLTNTLDNTLWYHGIVYDNVTVANSGNCNVTVSVPFHFEGAASTTGVQGGGGGGGGGNVTDYDCHWEDEEEQGGAWVCEEVHYQRISAYPNPTSHHFTIPFVGSTHRSVFLLYNAGGTIVGKKENPTEDILWETADLPNGLYILRHVNGNSITHEKLLINHR